MPPPPPPPSPPRRPPPPRPPRPPRKPEPRPPKRPPLPPPRPPRPPPPRPPPPPPWGARIRPVDLCDWHDGRWMGKWIAWGADASLGLPGWNHPEKAPLWTRPGLIDSPNAQPGKQHVWGGGQAVSCPRHQAPSERSRVCSNSAGFKQAGDCVKRNARRPGSLGRFGIVGILVWLQRGLNFAAGQPARQGDVIESRRLISGQSATRRRAGRALIPTSTNAYENPAVFSQPRTPPHAQTLPMASEAEGCSSSAAAVVPEAGEAQQQQQAAQEAAAVVVAEGDEAQQEEEEVRGCLGCKHRMPIAAAAAGLILHCASYPI